MKLKGAVYETYVRPTILYGSEACCLNEGKMGILQRIERSMCRIQLTDGKKYLRT